MKDKKILLFGLGLGMVLINASCSRQKEAAVSEQKTDSEVVNQNKQAKIKEFFNSGLYFVGETKDEIIKNLGKAVNSKTSGIKDQSIFNITSRIHAYEDRIIGTNEELFYNGLYIKIHKFKLPDKEIIVDLLINSDKYKLKWGLNVGVSKEYVEKILGSPRNIWHSLYIYEFPISSVSFATSTIIVYFKNDIVYQIEFYYHPD